MYNFLRLELPDTHIYSGIRTIIPPREIDIWIPSKNLGVEYNGLFYHNASSKTKTYHLWKTEEAEKKGIRLISIFSDEWENKRPIVADLLRKAIGKYQVINVEDCYLRTITRKETQFFLENCDLLGDIQGDIEYGIMYNNEILAVAVVDNQEDQWIIKRYSERRGIVVPKVLTFVINALQTIENKEITAICDRRLYNGVEFLETGFELFSNTEPNTLYTKDFKSKFTLDQLKLTESQIREKDYVEVYDCGNRVFKKKES